MGPPWEEADQELKSATFRQSGIALRSWPNDEISTYKTFTGGVSLMMENVKVVPYPLPNITQAVQKWIGNLLYENIG